MACSYAVAELSCNCDVVNVEGEFIKLNRGYPSVLQCSVNRCYPNRPLKQELKNEAARL